MRISISWIKKHIACCLVVVLAAPLSEALAAELPSAPQPTSSALAGQSHSPASSSPSQQNSGSGQSAPDSGATASQPAQTTQGQVSAAAPASSQQNSTRQPLGTAAAPYVKPEGVPASRPAGAVLAPAKQRRVRKFAIRLGLIAGAAIAIGTVAAASMGSPTRPH